MRICLLILSILISFTWAESSIFIGHTYSKLFQAIPDSNKHYQSFISGRPAFFLEFDSKEHPLFLEKDYSAYGIGGLSESKFQDADHAAENILIFPLYFNYYLNILPDLYLGSGLNISFIQLSQRNINTLLTQQLGKQISLRYQHQNNLLEFGIMQTCADYYNSSSDNINFFDITNYYFKYGFYLDNNSI